MARVLKHFIGSAKVNTLVLNRFTTKLPPSVDATLPQNSKAAHPRVQSSPKSSTLKRRMIANLVEVRGVSLSKKKQRPTPAGKKAKPLAKRKASSSTSNIWRLYARSGHGSPLENKLMEDHLPLVKNVVGRLAMTLPSHIHPEDLYSSGLVGLLNALRRFNPKSGTSFETYARVRIRGAVLDELRKIDWVPRSIHDKARLVEKCMAEIEQQKGRIPSEAEMAKSLKLSITEYRQLLEEVRPATFVCLDAARGLEEDGSSRYESMADEKMISPDERVERREMAQLIATRIRQLPEMQRKVLALYYYEDLRLREIAAVFGVTESRICQIHAQALLSVKAGLKFEEVALLMN
jgi:RNA polymerase sigma factor for flagellar operon FliA